MALPRWRLMRVFRPRVLAATDLPDEIADHARALAVALANPSTPHDERVALRRAFSKKLSAEVWSIRLAGWDEFHREFWETYELPRPVPTRLTGSNSGLRGVSATNLSHKRR
jgi:hypothetical protein